MEPRLELVDSVYPASLQILLSALILLGWILSLHCVLMQIPEQEGDGLRWWWWGAEVCVLCRFQNLREMVLRGGRLRSDYVPEHIAELHGALVDRVFLWVMCECRQQGGRCSG